MTLAVAVGHGPVLGQDAARPVGGWDFKFKRYLIGAWLGPDGTDAEVRVYKDAGFNVVMVGRYMAHGEYALPERVAQELDLAQRHGLGAMIDTYTQNDKPWGGVIPARQTPGHHCATLEELKWIHERFGGHPALVGYLLGDDQGAMSPQLVACTKFLRENAPHLMPWICGWVPAAELAAHDNPFVNWQIYPTLYNTNESAKAQARRYCEAYDRMRRDCLRRGLTPWPMFNACGDDVSDSTLRFPIYAALAYGAQGIWYFTYRTALTRSKEGQRGFERYEDALANVKPNYYVAKKANHRVLAWGPKLLGRKCEGVLSTGWRIENAVGPGPDVIVTGMSEDLLVGILTKPQRRLMAMVVDKRVSKEPGATPPREVELTFSEMVTRIEVMATPKSRSVQGHRVGLTLEGGEGMLLGLTARRGMRQDLERLASGVGNRE